MASGCVYVSSFLIFLAGIWKLRGTAVAQLCPESGSKFQKRDWNLKVYSWGYSPVVPHLTQSYLDFSMKVSLGWK